ncbi:MAG: FAD-binding oxidoreductase [Myxococcaceae bacterium]|nr:FAD-binding oxidoreductase [Myxococcaceae bacterium]
MGRHAWGWGLEERAIPLDEVRPRVEPFFGSRDELKGAPPRVPAPRVEVPLAVRAFASAADDVRAAHAMGKAYPDRIRGFRGDFSTAPDVVVMPRSELELVQALECATVEQLSVTPFGGGSSVVGGVEPVIGKGHRGTMTLDLSALGQMREVDAVSRLARIEGGAFGPALEQQLGTHGLTLRHFPQSFEFSTLGGWIATRAGGHFATGPTHIDDLVHSVRMVTPTGLFETKSFPASGAGVDPNRLVLGSEGIFGVITEAWMRVRPKPTFRASASVHFDEYRAAVDAVRALSQSGLQPANCRLLDPAEAMVNGVTFDGSAVLVLGFESSTHSMREWIDQALRVTAQFQGRCEQGAQVLDGGGERADDAGQSWRRSFLQGPYLQDALIRLGLVADTFETACTWSRFHELYAGVTGAVMEGLQRLCGGGVVSCRLTHVYPDGPAPYFTFIGPAREGEELSQWTELKRLASDAVAAHGGTITHHHAVGRTHRPWYEREVPAAFRASMAAVKRQLDPSGLLNPGVLLDQQL